MKIKLMLISTALISQSAFCDLKFKFRAGSKIDGAFRKALLHYYSEAKLDYMQSLLDSGISIEYPTKSLKWVRNDFADLKPEMDGHDDSNEGKTCPVHIKEKTDGKGEISVDGKVVGGSVNAGGAVEREIDTDVDCDDAAEIVKYVIKAWWP